MEPRYVITGQYPAYRVQFKGANGEIVWWTENYRSKQSARDAIAFARKHAATASVIDISS